MEFSVGDSIPAFSLSDHNGEERTFPVEGSPTVLIFYRGDW